MTSFVLIHPSGFINSKSISIHRNMLIGGICRDCNDVSGCDDGNVRFWNIDTIDSSKDIAFVIKGHEMRVKNFMYCHDTTDYSSYG